MIKVYIIAGEHSGDNIGANVIQQLNQISNSTLEFRGIGGKNMQAAGLESLFDMQHINLMGFWEIIPKLLGLRRLIKRTIDDIVAYRPTILITIDSPGFNLRVASKVKAILKDSYRLKLIHIVAPSVWAYKPQRAAKFAAIYDLLLTLLPFEPPYFEKVGLTSRFIGHPVLDQQSYQGNKQSSQWFYDKYQLSAKYKLICLTPGSRYSEINSHLDIFLEATIILQHRLGEYIQVAIAAANHSLVPYIQCRIQKCLGKKKDAHIKIVVITEDVFACYKLSDIVLAKSGTNTLEISKHHTPLIIAYKMHMISWWYIKRLIRIRFASLINIIADEQIIPEFIQNNCTPVKLASSLYQLMNDHKLVDTQLTKTNKILHKMNVGRANSSSALAAQYILELL